jgi:hypothetical protein
LFLAYVYSCFVSKSAINIIKIANKVKKKDGAGGTAFGAADLYPKPLGVPPFPAELAGYDSSVAAVRAALEEEAFKAAWEEGRRMTMAEAIQLAVGSKQ